MTSAARSYPALTRALRQRREQLGLSPAQVDAAAGLPRDFTSRLEAGHAYLSVKTTAPLLAVLGLRLVVRPVGSAA